MFAKIKPTPDIPLHYTLTQNAHTLLVQVSFITEDVSKNKTDLNKDECFHVQILYLKIFLCELCLAVHCEAWPEWLLRVLSHCYLVARVFWVKTIHMHLVCFSAIPLSDLL